MGKLAFNYQSLILQSEILSESNTFSYMWIILQVEQIFSTPKHWGQKEEWRRAEK